MPILDVGYRNWEGHRTPLWTRAAIIASTGIHLVWQGTWLKRVLLFMVVPAAVAAFIVGTFEQTIERPEARTALKGAFRSPAVKQAANARDIDLDTVLDQPETLRHFSWSYVLFGLLRYPQSIGMIVLIGLVAPRLISYDLRSRGYLLYLSRPLTPFEYVLGKAGIVYFLLFMMSAVPALLVYVVGLFLSTDPWAISHTWDLPLRILAAALVLILPTTAVALALSSLTQESRFAGFAWFALWVLGSIAFRILWAAEQARNGGLVREVAGFEWKKWRASRRGCYCLPTIRSATCSNKSSGSFRKKLPHGARGSCSRWFPSSVTRSPTDASLGCSRLSRFLRQPHFVGLPHGTTEMARNVIPLPHSVLT